MSQQKMDILLRDILQKIPEKFVYLLTGKKGTKILDNAFPTIKKRKADFVVELEDSSIWSSRLTPTKTCHSECWNTESF